MNKETFKRLFKNKKAIIFDCDGTLLDSIDTWAKVDSVLIEMLTGTPKENFSLDQINNDRSDFVHNNHTGEIYINYAKFLCEKYNPKFDPWQLHLKRVEIADDFTKHLDFREGADIFLKIVKKYGYKTCLATLSTEKEINVYRNENQNFINKANLDKTFDVILSKEDVSSKKPNPEIYLKAVEKLGFKKEECLVFEDSYSGVMASKNAELDVIAIREKHSDCDKEKILNMADAYIQDYAEILKLIGLTRDLGKE